MRIVVHFLRFAKGKKSQSWSSLNPTSVELGSAFLLVVSVIQQNAYKSKLIKIQKSRLTSKIKSICYD